MSYLEIIQRALKGRSVYAAAKQWGIPQKTLDNYANGKRIPDPITAKIIKEEAGITADEMMETLAIEEAKRRSKLEKISRGFKALLRAANACRVRIPQVA